MSLKCATSLEVLKEHQKLFYKTVPIKPYINKEIKNRSLQFSYTVIVVTIKMKLLEVLTPTPDIYHGPSTWKMFWEENSTLVNTTSCVRCNVRKQR